MAINFPSSSLSSGDTHTVGTTTWEWNGTYWAILANKGSDNLDGGEAGTNYGGVDNLDGGSSSS